MSRRVIPLESNPDVFNKMAHEIGLSPVLLFHDVYSITEPALLAMIPQPVMAVVMLFPITEQYKEYKRSLVKTEPPNSTDIRWFRQTIGNACGLYALLHGVANLPSDFIVKESLIDSILLQHLKPGISPESTTKLVELLEESLQLDANYGAQGQTEAPSADAEVYFHFITFVKGQNGHVYELDGGKPGPLDLGELPEDKPLLDAVVPRVQFYMGLAGEEAANQFALMAIAPSFID